MRVWKSIDAEFGAITERLTRRLAHLDQLATFLHRDQVHKSFQEQLAFRAQTAKALEKLARPDDQSAMQMTLQHQLVSWISPVDLTEVLHHNAFKRSPDTCLWLLKEPVYTQWASVTDVGVNNSSIGWVNGNAGMGKTVLCASIVQCKNGGYYGAQNDIEIAPIYFFFDKNDRCRNTILQMYQAILAQLLTSQQSKSAALAVLEPAYRTSREYGGAQMTWNDAPAELLKAILMKSRGCTTRILLDGLDECVSCDEALSDFANFIDLVKSSHNCRTLMFSRYTSEIKNILTNIPALRITAELTRSDVDTYLRTQIHGSPTLKSVLSAQIVSQLSQSADGMFLWAHMAMERMKTAVSPSDLADMVSRAPEGLDVFYELALQNLANGPLNWLELARKLLLHVLSSPRPLTWAEVQCSLALDPGDPEGDTEKERRPYLHAVLKTCPPFIDYSPESETFRASHLSVHQFLTSPNPDTDATGLRVFPPLAHQKLSKICLAYLQQAGLRDQIQVDASRYPLSSYATTYLCFHLERARSDAQLWEHLAAFLSCTSTRRTWLVRWIYMELESFPLHKILKTLADLQHYLRNEDAAGVTLGSEFDALEDATELLALADDPSIASCPAHRKISHFERIMFIRDLAREHTRIGRLQEAIARLNNLKTRLDAQSDAKDLSGNVWILIGLGILYDQQGEVQRSLETQLEALAIQDDAPSSNRLQKSLTFNELGRIYRHLKEYAKSTEMHLKALEILRSMSLPDTDPQIIWTISTLARCYRMDGRLDEGLRLSKQALAGRQRLLGAEHPHTLWIMSDIAKCHRELGDLTTARDVQKESVRLREKVLGPKHYDTLWAMNDLGIIYEIAGCRDEALEIHNTAWEGQMSTLGKDHRTTTWSRAAIERLSARKSHLPSVY